jgi:hypothetical protein
MKIRNYTLDTFTTAYLVCALWSSNDESTPAGGEPMDQNYSLDDISDKTLEQAIADCTKFQSEMALYLTEEDLVKPGRFEPLTHGGNDFWLTRNGHGAGFWDGDWNEPAATKLTDACKAYREINLYGGDDKQIYAE